jgi:hypothetical protein
VAVKIMTGSSIVSYGKLVDWIMHLPIEKFVGLSMSAMSLAIAFGPDRGVADFVNRFLANATSYDFALLLAASGLFMFVYDRNQPVVFIMSLPLWAYMLLSVPYVFSQPGSPPTLPIICLSYLYIINRVFHYHRRTGYYVNC